MGVVCCEQSHSVRAFPCAYMLPADVRMCYTFLNEASELQSTEKKCKIVPLFHATQERSAGTIRCNRMQVLARVEAP